MQLKAWPRMYCSVCGQKFESSESLGGHVRLCKQKHALESDSRPIESKPNTNPLARWGYDRDAKVTNVLRMLDGQIEQIKRLIERFPKEAAYESRLRELQRLSAHRDEIKRLNE